MESDWTAKNYFQSGADAAAALTLAVGPISSMHLYESNPIVFKEKAMQGNYSDPNHPGCPRALVVYDEQTGEMYGNDDCETLQDPWGPLPVTISDYSIVCDFSSKGGPSDLAGTYADGDAGLGTITWADGNVWTQTMN